MLTLATIARVLGGQVSGNELLCPTPGHSSRDRGTAIRLAPGAPDGVLVTCFNGGQAEALAVKDTLRAAGVLPAWTGTRREPTLAEREAIRRAEAEREREQQERWRNAAGIARQRMAQAGPADPAHPYLVRKRIAPERLRQEGDRLLVPMADESGTVWNMQAIGPDGFKMFAKGGRTKGLFWWAGKPADRLVIGEGMATVAAVRRATALPVVAAMNCHNLPAVAAAIRARRPDLALIIAADDDAPGHEAARRAAEITGAAIAIPELPA